MRGGLPPIFQSGFPNVRASKGVITVNMRHLYICILYTCTCICHREKNYPPPPPQYLSTPLNIDYSIIFIPLDLETVYIWCVIYIWNWAFIFSSIHFTLHTVGSPSYAASILSTIATVSCDTNTTSGETTYTDE